MLSRKLVLLIFLSPFFATAAYAQVDTGSIVGTVTDGTGASIAGATVTLSDEATNQAKTQTSGHNGSYSFSPLAIGSYTLTVEESGFKTLIQKQIQVTVQGQLQVGEATENVQVTSSGPILETQTSSMQQLIDQKAINDLSLNGRNATFLAQLSPGVTIAQNDSRRLQASGSFTANGSRRTQNDYLLDGMDDNIAVADLVNQSQFAVFPPPDALREFTVQTSDYSAEFGHAAGAVLNVTTKSGSNAIHDDLWEFLRNDMSALAPGTCRCRFPTNTVNNILPPSTNVKTVQFFPDFANGGTFIARAGQTNYNSLQANVEHRFSSNFSLLANFTWSKCLGDSRDQLDNGIGSYRAPYVPGLGMGADYGLCDIDVRRIVHAGGTYQLQFGKNQRWLTHGAPAWALGGWSTNWILTAQDGQLLTIGCSTTNASGLGCNALKVPGQNPYAGSHNAAQFLNPSAFANPPAATAASASPANLGGSPTQVTGPPYRRLNLSLFRRFRAVEATYLEFRAEVFNLTNTPNFGQPGSLSFTTPNSFASISATRDNPNDPREIQLSLKYYY